MKNAATAPGMRPVAVRLSLPLGRERSRLSCCARKYVACPVRALSMSCGRLYNAEDNDGLSLANDSSPGTLS